MRGPGREPQVAEGIDQRRRKEKHHQSGDAKGAARAHKRHVGLCASAMVKMRQNVRRKKIEIFLGFYTFWKRCKSVSERSTRNQIVVFFLGKFTVI